MTRPSGSVALRRLVGQWEVDDASSAAVFEIDVIGGKPVVSGFDKTDGERFKISAIEWDGSSLGFTALMPSTQYRTGHKITFVKAGVVSHETTFFERWKRVRP